MASAQSWTPGSEIVGHPATVTTNGIADTVTLNADGTARVVTPGGREVPASWTNAGGQLCVRTGLGSECWTPQAPLQAGQPVTWMSNCNSATTWLASEVNTPPPPPPAPEIKGERG
jgi:hypothetical protein